MAHVLQNVWGASSPTAWWCAGGCFYELERQLVIHRGVHRLHGLRGCMSGARIYAGKTSPEFQSDIEFNAMRPDGCKNGAGCHRDEKGSLADRRQKKAEFGY